MDNFSRNGCRPPQHLKGLVMKVQELCSLPDYSLRKVSIHLIVRYKAQTKKIKRRRNLMLGADNRRELADLVTGSGSRNGQHHVETANRGVIRRLDATMTRSMAPPLAAASPQSEATTSAGLVLTISSELWRFLPYRSSYLNLYI